MSTHRVSISISDPWDLGESLEWKPLKGELQRVAADGKGGKALIHLDVPLTYRDATCRYLVATPRHAGIKVSSVQEGAKVFCAFTGVSDARAVSEDPTDCSDWRGGIAAIGDLQIETL